VVIGPDPVPPLHDLYESWDKRLAEEEGGGIFLHPQLALSAMQVRGATPVVYAGAAAEGVASLGVLVDRPYPIRPVAGLPWQLTLRGYKLLGSRLAGIATPEVAGEFCDWIAPILRSTGKECLYLEDLEVGSPMRDALVGRRRSGIVVLQTRPPEGHWWIRFPERPEAYWDQFSGRTRSKFRQKSRKLGALRCFQTEDEVQSFFGQAREVSESSWQSKRLGLRISAGRDEIGFWKTVARLGAMRSYILEHEDKPVAFALAAQWNGTLSYEEIAFDPEYADLSPGTVLLFRILQDVVERDPVRKFDFGIGDAEYKHLFANHQTQSGPVLVIRRRLRPIVAAGLAAIRQRASGLARAGLQNSWLLRAARRRTRRQA
jgi:CelD/BcsL family acetyltransferase involved in cellulose biosynthesis